MGAEVHDSSLSAAGFISVSDLLRQLHAPPDLIEGLIPSNALVGIVAPPGSAKSLLALHLAGCVATGQSFGGRKCASGLAVYLCGEGHAGLTLRLQALDKHHKLGLDGTPLVFSKFASSLIDREEVLRIRRVIDEAVKLYNVPLALLVVDTAAKFIAPGDESSAKDMSAFLSAIDYLRGSATALICHHPGHDQRRPRGSSAFTAALDVEYSISKEGDIVRLACQKIKDGESPGPVAFRLRSAETLIVGHDGEPKMSVVLTEADPENTNSQPTGRNQLKLLLEIRRLVSKGHSGVWTETQLRALARDIGMHKSSATSAVKSLLDHSHIEVTDGGLRLADVATDGMKERT
jgi:hypothetical protein